MAVRDLFLTMMNDTYAVCMFDANAPIPHWVLGASFFSVTKTRDELSIVCKECDVPGSESVKMSRGWRMFAVKGPLDFSETGIIASLAAPLAEAHISTFVVSTYMTDYLLVQESTVADVVRILSRERSRPFPAITIVQE